MQDPRISLSNLVLTEQDDRALQQSEAVLRENPEQAHEIGVEYLRGHLLDRLDRRREAVDAYALAMTVTPSLKPYASFRLALNQERLGHPETATGLTVQLLASNPPSALVEPATQLLVRTLAEGGDCRHLDSLGSSGFRAKQRRVIDLARADCALRQGRSEDANGILLNLLQENRNDLTARIAAERLAAISPTPGNLQVVFLLGLTFHSHREFDRSASYLQQIVVHSTLAPQRPGPAPASVPLTREEFDTQYRWARSLFWQGRFSSAAAGFGQLAERARRSREKAKAFYNQGRSYELLGDWTAAAKSYRRAFLADRLGKWSGAALLSTLRVEWRSGQDEPAEELLRLLQTEWQWRREASRGALFVAVSELVRGRLASVGFWLSQAERLDSRHDPVELAYWKGRLAEQGSRQSEAVDLYLRAARLGAYHPLARSARRRLSSNVLQDAVREKATALAASKRLDDLYSRVVLLGDDDPTGRRAREELETRLLDQRSTQPFARLEIVPIGDWPLWQKHLTQPAEILLALGIWEEGAPAVRRHFPLSEVALALTASRHLEGVGQVRQSLLIAEILSKQIPTQLPDEMVAEGYRRLLYPLSHRDHLFRSARRHGVDPYLLAAIIREESRFDPGAVSTASARGLTQFVFPTAQRVARTIGFGPISPRDLENPEISIELGAAHLAQLGKRFSGALPQMIAAYNAGEPQTSLWQSYCYSRAPEEFVSKVGFPQTRSYVIKVLASRAQYAELYSQPGPAPRRSPAAR